MKQTNVARGRRSMKTKVSPAREIVRATRQRGHIKSEHALEDECVDRREDCLVGHGTRSNEGVLDWLLACPEKDFFVPLESQATSTLRRSRLS
jgi:hypothetical protein